MASTPSPSRHTRRLAAILFSDIRGYSRQMGRDENGAMDRLEAHNAVWREEVERHQGRVVKTIGDAFMVEFSSSVDAVGCALAVQRRLKLHNAARPAQERTEVRVGVHVGDVVVKDGDLLGDAVNLAARLEGQAPVGTVCVSVPVLEQVAGKVNASLQDLGERELKNIDRPMRLYALSPSQGVLKAPPKGAPPRRAWRRPALVGALGTLVLGAVATAAWTLARTPDAAAPVAEAGPQRGGTLRVGMHGTTLPPFQAEPTAESMSSFIMTILMQAMVPPVDENEAAPPRSVFSSVRLDDDGTALEVQLRENVRFHDQPCTGNMVRAADAGDIVFSLETAAREGNLDVPLAGLGDFLDGKSPSIAGIRETGPLTVRLQFTQRMALVTFLHDVWLLPKEHRRCDNLRDLKHPVGAGPFKLDAVSGDNVRLVRFLGFGERDEPGGALPFLDALEFRPLPDVEGGLAALQEGRLDVMILKAQDARPHVVMDAPGHFLASPALQAAGVRVAPSVFLNGRDLHNLWFLAATRGPLADARVRRAVGHSLRRERYVDPNALVPQAPCDRYLRVGDVGFDPAAPVLGFNPGEAARLLKEAGFAGGHGLPELVIAHDRDDDTVMGLMVEDLARAGIRARGMLVSEADVEGVLANRTADALLMILAGTVSQRDPWRLLHETSSVLRDFHHPQERMESLFHKVEAESDRVVRGRLYEQVEWQLLVDAPALPLVCSTLASVDPNFTFFFTRDNVRGLVDADGTIRHLNRFKRVWLQPGK